MNKRNIRKAEEFNEKDQKGFFMIGKKDASIAILNKLTGTQMRLWVYLMMIDTFADFTKDGEKIYKPIPSPQEIGIRLGIHHETVTKDLRKLKKLDLYDYRIVNWQGHNTTAYKASLQSSELKKKRNSRGDVKYGSNRGDVEYGNSRYDVKYESTSLAHNSETCNKRSVHFHTITDEDQTYRISTEQTTGVSIDDEGVAIDTNNESYTGYALGLNNPSQGLNNLSKGLNNLSGGLNNLFGGLNNPQFGLNNPSFITKPLPCNDFSLSQTVQTIQTKQKKHTLSDRRKQKEQNNNNTNSNNTKKGINKEEYYSSTTGTTGNSFHQNEIEESYKINYTDSGKDQKFRSRSTNVAKNKEGLVPLSQLMNNSVAHKSPVQQRHWNWLPEGEWCINGKLDPAFQEWLAKKWVKKYQCDIHEAKANVLSCFRNDPTKLPIRWQQYHEEYLSRAEVLKAHLDNDLPLSDEQKKQAITHARALRGVSASQSVTCTTKEKEELKQQNLLLLENKHTEKPVLENSSSEMSETLEKSHCSETPTKKLPEDTDAKLSDKDTDKKLSEDTDAKLSDKDTDAKLSDKDTDKKLSDKDTDKKLSDKDTDKVNPLASEAKGSEISLESFEERAEVDRTHGTSLDINHDNLDSEKGEEKSKEVLAEGVLSKISDKTDSTSSQEEVPVNPKAVAMINNFINSFGGGNVSENTCTERSRSTPEEVDSAVSAPQKNTAEKVEDVENSSIAENTCTERSRSTAEEVKDTVSVSGENTCTERSRSTAEEVENATCMTQENTTQEEMYRQAWLRNKKKKNAGDTLSDDPETLKLQAETLNISLRHYNYRKQPYVMEYIEKFLSLGWLVDYDKWGYPVEVYQF